MKGVGTHSGSGALRSHIFFVNASSNIATFGDENGIEAMLFLLMGSKTGDK